MKTELAAGAHNLKYLYADGGDDDTEDSSEALRMLISVVIRALKSKNRLSAQLAEVRLPTDIKGAVI